MATLEGWSNGATHAVVLAINNDRQYHKDIELAIQTAVWEAPASEQVTEGIWTTREAEVFILEGLVRDWAEEELSREEVPLFFQNTMIDVAMAEVNWLEIAQDLLENFHLEHNND